MVGVQSGQAPQALQRKGGEGKHLQQFPFRRIAQDPVAVLPVLVGAKLAILQIGLGQFPGEEIKAAVAPCGHIIKKILLRAFRLVQGQVLRLIQTELALLRERIGRESQAVPPVGGIRAPVAEREENGVFDPGHVPDGDAGGKGLELFGLQHRLGGAAFRRRLRRRGGVLRRGILLLLAAAGAEAQQQEKREQKG